VYIITGKFKGRLGKKEELLTLVANLIEPSRREKGCISYNFYEDQFHPEGFLFYEEWETREDIEIHFAKPYFRIFMEQFADLIEGKPIITISNASTIERL
jgi:quinol monooxygenase YgiN